MTYDFNAGLSERVGDLEDKLRDLFYMFHDHNRREMVKGLLEYHLRMVELYRVELKNTDDD